MVVPCLPHVQQQMGNDLWDEALTSGEFTGACKTVKSQSNEEPRWLVVDDEAVVQVDDAICLLGNYPETQ